MIKIALSILGTLGFCPILNVPKNKIIWVTLGAAISASIFETLYSNFGFGIFISTFAAALTIGVYSEIIARIIKTPSTVILLPSTIPLLPGGSLFYAMNNLVSGSTNHFIKYAVETINTGVGIALGAVGASICVMIIRYFRKNSKES